MTYVRMDHGGTQGEAVPVRGSDPNSNNFFQISKFLQGHTYMPIHRVDTDFGHGDTCDCDECRLQFEKTLEKKAVLAALVAFREKALKKHAIAADDAKQAFRSATKTIIPPPGDPATFGINAREAENALKVMQKPLVSPDSRSNTEKEFWEHIAPRVSTDFAYGLACLTFLAGLGLGLLLGSLG